MFQKGDHMVVLAALIIFAVVGGIFVNYLRRNQNDIGGGMGKDYMKGAKQFIEQIKTTIFVPMHFSEDYEGGNALRSFAENAGCRFISITHRGESFEITK
jgi:hypothetical protein